MDPVSLINELSYYANEIDAGRKAVATKGKAEKGRISYESGVSGALAAFQEAQSTADPQTLVLAEMNFLQQELRFCHETDTDAKSSLTQAIQSFDDALLSLEAVEDPTVYLGADKTYPHNPKTRIQDCPRDAFHHACVAHRTRLRNVLCSPGINMIEKAVLEQRAANMTTAQASYVAKQKKALGHNA
jgi:hypothetical protein